MLIPIHPKAGDAIFLRYPIRLEKRKVSNECNGFSDQQEVGAINSTRSGTPLHTNANHAEKNAILRLLK